MKRGLDDHESTPAPKKPPRQDPVSCQTCRKRKLKCNRAIPCGSCSARRLECIYLSRESGVVPSPSNHELPPQSQHGDEVTAAQNSSVPSMASSRNPAYSSVTFSHYHPVPVEARRVPSTPKSDKPGHAQSGDDSIATVERLETIVMGHWIPNAVPTNLRDNTESSTCASVPSGTYAATSEWQRGMMERYHIISRESPNLVHLSSHLPPLEEALCMFRYYCAHLDCQYHVILPSQTQQQIREIYDAISSQQPINLSHTALLFSIIASVLYYKLQGEPSEYAEICSQAAAFLTGAALTQSNYISYPTLGGLQATMVIGHNLSNTTLPSAVSSFFVHRLYINQAVNMKLHLLDCPRASNDHATAGSPEIVLLELKRRIWWDLVAYDWLLSYLGGPQQWTYSVMPHQMNVRLPLNIEDDNVGRVVSEAPLSTPTVMSYSLCRLKLAIVSREIADDCAQNCFHDEELPYDKVIELDRKLRNSMNELPEFFRFGQKAQREYAELYRERPNIAWQRSMLMLGYHFRFCRLHRRYFVRGAKDPKYSYSHVICLQSARTVLEIKRVMDEVEPVFQPSSSLIWAVMHHVFMAAVILLVDLCFNWEDVLAEKRKEEVLAACKLLTRARQSSAVAHRAVDAMMEVLRKYWQRNKGPPCNAADAQEVAKDNHPKPSEPAGNPQGATWAPPLEDVQQDPFDAPLEDFWTGMLDGTTNPTLDSPDWADLLTELTNGPFAVG